MPFLWAELWGTGQEGYRAVWLVEQEVLALLLRCPLPSILLPLCSHPHCRLLSGASWVLLNHGLHLSFFTQGSDGLFKSCCPL